MVPQLLYVRPARARAVVGVVAIGLLMAACAAVPDRLQAGADPADPAAGVPSAGYRPVLSGYVRQRPVEPAPWRQQNERVAPQPKPDQ